MIAVPITATDPGIELQAHTNSTATLQIEDAMTTHPNRDQATPHEKTKHATFQNQNL
jgi:hypothetical protein